MRWAVIVLGLAAFGLSGCPEMAITPDSAPQGARSFEIQLQGTNTTWSDGSTQAEFLVPSGIVIRSFEVTGKFTAVMFVDVPSGEPIGDQTIQLTTGAEVVSATFSVTAGPVVSLHPPSAEQYEFGQEVRIEGTDTTFTAPGFAVAVHIPGVTMVGAPIVVSDTEAHVVLDVDISAEVRTYTDAFVVTTNWQDVSLDFEITPVQGRAITLDPDSSDTGEIVLMTITGSKTFFDDASLTWEGMFDIDSWDGLEVMDHKVVSATELYLELWVHTEATPGVRTITVTDIVGALDAEFTVLSDTTAPTVDFFPSSAQPREDPPVVANGTFTSFSDGVPATTVEVVPFGQGFAMQVYQVVGTETINLRTIIDIDVVPQTYEVIFRTGPELVRGAFVVDPLPEASITLSDTSGQQLTVIPEFEITGVNTHFEANGATIPEVSGGGGVTLTDFVVVNELLATATLTIAETAATGDHTITMRTDLWNETPSAIFTVNAGDPSVTLNQTSVNQGDEDVPITATGHFVGWDSSTTVTSSSCDLGITVAPGTTAGLLNFDVTVPLFHNEQTCTLLFTTSGQPPVTADLDVQSTATPVVIGYDEPHFLSGPDRFAITLAQGDVIKARATRAIWASIDMVMGIYGSGSSVNDPLIENDDESAATVNPLVVFQAPEAGTYFLYVRERWSDSFTGNYWLTIDRYTPTDNLEVAPITTADDLNDDPNSPTELGAATASWHVRGAFQTDTPEDTSDFYSVIAATGVPLALQIVARDVSPSDISTAEVSVLLWGNDTTNALTPTIYSHEGIDPMMYVTLPASFTDLLIEVVRAPGCPENTTYWLNVRPALVINEVMFDHDNGFYASFVELHGEPSASLAGCELRLVDDTISAPPIPLVDNSPMPAPYELTEYGYLVVAHDTGTPGVGQEHVKPQLLFTDTGVDQAVQLWCNGALIDAVQYRGNPNGGGENAPATEPPSGKSIGRGFHADSDDNASDFMEQIEPSPWMRNLTEVRR